MLAAGGKLALSTWDVPERARLVGIFVDAVSEAGAILPAHIPEGPPFFRFSDEEELAELLRGAGLHEVEVRTIAFTHRFSSAEELWEGMLSGTVRTDYSVNGGLEIPISVKLASARLEGRQ